MKRTAAETSRTPVAETAKNTPRLVKATDLARRAATQAIREAQAATGAKTPAPLLRMRAPRGATEARAAFAVLFDERRGLEKQAS